MPLSALAACLALLNAQDTLPNQSLNRYGFHAADSRSRDDHPLSLLIASAYPPLLKKGDNSLVGGVEVIWNHTQLQLRIRQGMTGIPRLV